MMEERSAYKKMKLRLQEWYQSEEYQRLCRHFSAECARLSEVAQRLYPQVETLQAACQERTVRQELAVQCRYMHRGFYCPSPVYDLVISNSRRGSILKRPTSRSKPTHMYGFDDTNRLLWCHNKQTDTTEYLLYENNAVYGIIVNAEDNLSTLTEEIYQNGKLSSYLIASSFHVTSSPSCERLFAEYYENDEDGLCAVQMYDFTTPMTSIPDFLTNMGMGEDLLQPSCLWIANWRFERENGFLTGYRTYPTAFDRSVSPVFPIHIPRKS